MKRRQFKISFIMEKETRKCPYCGEEILAVAKKCKFCGEWLTEEKAEDTPKQMISCPICSEMIEEGTEICPHCHEKLTKPGKLTPAITKTIKTEKEDDGTRSFFDYYLWDPFFRHYFDFKGRLNRKHYWLSIMVWLGVCLALIVMLPPIGAFIFMVFFVVSIIPLYATAARRMRDGDSIPGIFGWISLFFPTVLWWLVKPTEYRAEGMEDAEPDIPQPVKFKKVDKIICCVYALLFVIAIAVFYIEEKKDNTVNATEQIEMTDENYKNEESELSSDIISVEEALTLYNIKDWSDKVERFLLDHGYEYVGEVDNSSYWTKNCKLGRGQYGYGETESSPDGSYIIIRESIIEIYAFSESVFKAWFSQIKELGYVLDDEEGQGNQQLEWNASKDGEPDISFIEGNSYGMSIGSYEY